MLILVSKTLVEQLSIDAMDILQAKALGHGELAKSGDD